MISCFQKYCSKILCLFICLPPLVAFSQVTGWMPDTTMSQYSEFNLPIMVGGVEPEDSLLAYHLGVVYDTSLVVVTDVTSAGTITEDWGSPFFNIDEGEILIAGFSAYPADWIESGDQPLVILHFQIEKDTTCVTPINFSRFLLYNLNGEMSVDSLKGSILSLEPNYPPVIAYIPDLHIDEDESGFLRIDTYVSDANDSLGELTLLIDPVSNIAIVIDSTGWGLDIIPNPNWAGNVNVNFTVTDPFAVSTHGSFSVLVRSIDDPPGSFQLISPPDDSLITVYQNFLPFSWQQSENLDPNDVITYRFYIGTDSLNLFSGFGVQTPNTSLFYSGTLVDGTYFWGVKASDGTTVVTCDAIFSFQLLTTSVENDKNRMPDRYGLSQNYPNPFNPSTKIGYAMPKSGNVRIEIYDEIGRHIRTLMDQDMNPGFHEIDWDSKDERGNNVAAGVYLVRMQSGSFVEQRKMILIR